MACMVVASKPISENSSAAACRKPASRRAERSCLGATRTELDEIEETLILDNINRVYPRLQVYFFKHPLLLCLTFISTREKPRSSLSICKTQLWESIRPRIRRRKSCKETGRLPTSYELGAGWSCGSGLTSSSSSRFPPVGPALYAVN